MSNEHTIGDTRVTEHRQLTDGDATVTIRKLVSKGERLEISNGSAGVKLDALLLEGISWQHDRKAVADLIDRETAIATDPAATTAGDAAAEQGHQNKEGSDVDGITISSEYAHVVVRVVSTPAGDALAITAPGRGSTLALGVQSLQDLAAVEDTYVFSVWFETPFGPEDTPVEGPL